MSKLFGFLFVVCFALFYWFLIFFLGAGGVTSYIRKKITVISGKTNQLVEILNNQILLITRFLEKH